MTAAGLAPPRTPDTRRRPGGLFWHRDFRRLWIGQTTSTLGSSVTSVALPLVAVATLDASTFEVALLSAAAWLPWLLVGLPAGAWVDRVPRRPVMLACDLAALLLFLSVPVAAWLGRLAFGHLLAVALGAGRRAGRPTRQLSGPSACLPLTRREDLASSPWANGDGEWASWPTRPG